MDTLTDERCDRSDLPKSMCSHCKGLPWAAPADPLAERDERDTDVGDGDPFDAPAPPVDDRRGVGPGPWFMARYVGECSACGAGFLSGDEIRADGEGGFEGRCCR